MKSIKFLAALTIPAMFAACTNEEIVVESPKQFKQVVGAEFIGTNISMEMSNGVNSRMGSTGWEETDKLGLGWIVNGDYKSAQEVAKAPNSDEWFANHLFYVEDGKFITRGNVYKGWHFAYFPFAYKESIGVQEWDINPAQTSKEWASGRVNDALCISPLKFLSRESLDDNYQLKKEVEFSVERAVNSIHVTTTAADQFAGEGSLADLDVKSIKLALFNDGAHYPFCESMTMNVKNLPQETNEKVTREALLASFYAKTNPVFKKYSAQSITTDVAGAGFKVSEQTKLITLTAPYAGGDLKVENLGMDIVAGAGTFEIRYVKDAAEGTNAYTNNQALTALKEALAVNGTLTQVGTKLELDVVLYADIFKTDFLHISDLTEWKDAVDMVTKLGRTTETFGVDNVIAFNEGNIPMPEGCAITVNKATDATGEAGLKIAKTIENWPAGLTSNVKVYNEKTIKNATGINGEEIINTGTLNGISETVASLVTNAQGKISLTKTGALTNVNNAEGRITVKYGSKITFASDATDNGIIAYSVANSEKAYKLNNLMGKTSGQTDNAFVNTLVIGEGKTLNMGLTDQGNSDSDDPYYSTGGTADVALASLENINIELNGGTIVGVETNKVVNNVTMKGGTVDGVDIEGDLIAESGTITSGTIKGNVTAENASIAATEIKGNVSANNCNISVQTIGDNVTTEGTTTITGAEITGDVTVENGTATLNGVKINGTLTVKAGASVVLNSTEYIYITNIVNNGTLTANNDIFVTNVTLNPKSTTTLTDKEVAEKDWNKIIYYTGTYVNDKMTLNGTVLKYTLVSYDKTKSDEENGTVLTTALESAKAGDVVYVPAGNYDFKKTSEITLTDVSIIAEEGTVINSAVNSASDKVIYIYATGEEDILIKNITVNAVQTKADIWVKYENATVDGNVTFENVNAKSALIDNGYVDGIDVNVDIVNCKIGKFTVDGWNNHPETHSTNKTNVTYDSASDIVFNIGGNALENVTITKK